MHKKYTKFSHRDHHHHSSSSKRVHVKCRKENIDSALEVPQNSRNDLSKHLRLECGNNKENSKCKAKHKRKNIEEKESNDRHSKNRHEKKLVYNIADMEGLVLGKEGVSHKEKREKRDKERLNKIEKYLEGLDKTCSKKMTHNRSRSLGSSESVSKNREVSFRREKTFHEKPKRGTSSNGRFQGSQDRESQLPTTKQRKKSPKKHKYNKSKERESSKEKNTKDPLVSYCQIDTQNPFLHEKKKYEVERLYPETSNTINEVSGRRRSSSRDSYSSPHTKQELTSKRDRKKSKESKEKKSVPIKFSPRKSKLKTDLKNYRDQRSNASLGPYRKYFVFDKKSQVEKEVTGHRKKEHRKVDSAVKLCDVENKKERKAKSGKSNKNHDKTTVESDPFKEKIEDDIKSYFTKIQNLIDKKLDFILGNSNSKETKNSLEENESAVDKTKSKRNKKLELEDEKRPSDRSRSKKKRAEGTEKIEKHVVKVRHSDERKRNLESRLVKDRHTSNTSLKREKYPSADSRAQKRRQSSQRQWEFENYPSASPITNNLENNQESKQAKRKRSPYREYKECKMKPDQLINMLEHPSTFSIQSNTSLIRESGEEQPKRKSYKIQPDRSGNEHSYRRDRSSARRDVSPDEDNRKVKDVDQAYFPDTYTKKIKKRINEQSSLAVESNTHLTKEKHAVGSKHKLDTTRIVFKESGHQKRDKSPPRKYTIAGEDDFNIQDIKTSNLQEIHTKKLKKHMRQMMNLECKTVSIVGIPSQIRESTIFNETQTTTSLNVIDPMEDFIEKKKKSKRFKLYYKYSVADNKRSNDSDKSSEGKKSIISDSYKVVSDPSDHNIDVWEQRHVESNVASKESGTAELAKVLFIMKNEKFRKFYGDMSGGRNSMERALKKYRKRGESPKSSMLNNILEEPSNISIIVRHKESPTLGKDNLDCTFFNSLKSSSSEGNLGLVKKNEHTIPVSKHKTRHIEKHSKEIGKHKTPTKKSRQIKPEKKIRCDEKYEYHSKSHQKIKKKHIFNFTSKSDINISYDSLTKYKFKSKQKFDGGSHLREQLRYLLPEPPVRKADTEAKPIDLILKEELRQIIKEIPKSMVCKETSFGDLNQEETTKPPDTRTETEGKDLPDPDHKETKVVDQKNLQTEEKKYCSKKIGTHQPTTKIPSLIKGYVVKTTSQDTHGYTIDPSIRQEYQADAASDNVEEDTSGSDLENAAMKFVEMELQTTEYSLENKISQTPSKMDTAVEVAMNKITHKSKKTATLSTTKRCQIIDPLTNPKVGCILKPTRPIINLENNQFPNRKFQESDDVNRPIPYRRQRSSMSEGRTVTFERRSQDDKMSMKHLKPRPASVGDKFKEMPKTPTPRKPTKTPLTMSTNIVTINTPAIYDTQAKVSKKSVVFNSKQISKQYLFDKRSVTAGELSSRSAFSLGGKSKIASLVCVDKFSNYQKANLSSASNPRSLDQYAMKSIINDNPHSSRLFLTKNFSPQMNTYQRRKMYDECMRRKMKKKMGAQNQMGPRIYEVRYLTLENDNLNETLEYNDIQASINQRCITKLPTYNTKINKPRQRSKIGKPSIKKSKRNFPKNKEDACKFSGRDIFAPLTSDVDQLNKIRKRIFPEKTVEEIFVNDGVKETNGSVEDNDVHNSAVAEQKPIDNEHLNQPIMNKTDKENVDQNFKDLIDCLYSSIISYCNSKFKLPQEETSGPLRNQNTTESQKTVGEGITDPKPSLTKGKSCVSLPKPVQKKQSSSHEENPSPTANNSSKDPQRENNISSAEKQSPRSSNLACGHLSCPVLAGSSSSFEYLYEDGSIELNKEAVLLHFRKPMKTILGYALNNTRHVHKQALLNVRKKEDQVSNSATESEESGYNSSNNSKKCSSVCSFFKKPSIANLFKPIRKLECGFQSGASSVGDSRSRPNLQGYDVMNQKCIEYAEKVRIQSQNREEPGETFQEIPLDVLLFCRKSSTHIGDFNSNCSLCKEHSVPDLPDITEGDELSNCGIEAKNSSNTINSVQENEQGLVSPISNIQEETLFFYKKPDQRPSLEIISFQKSQTSFTNSQLTQEMAQCPVVLSITNLNTCSLTIIEQSENDNSQTKSDDLDESEDVQNDSNRVIYANESSTDSKTDLKSATHIDLDSRSDISSTCGFRNISSPSSSSKYMAKKFFDNLLKVYEKEMHVTKKLFQDDLFFANILLESIKSEQVTKPKNVKFKRLIKGKIKNYIGNVFFSKSGSDSRVDCSSTNTNPSGDSHQRKLQILAGDARKYFSMFVQAVKTNKDINDEVKICGLLKLLERIEDGDFAVLRKKEDVDFEEEIKEQVKEAFMNIYQISVKEAKKRRRSLTTNDVKLIRTFVSKYRIGLLSKTDLIASYIGRGVFKTEGHLKAAVTYLIQQNKNKDIDLRDFDQHCRILEKCSG